MNQNQRPHSRQKTVGHGSAGIGGGRQINTGSRPVGAGGRQSAPTGSRSGYPGAGGRVPGLPIRLSRKTVLILIAAAIVVFLLTRGCGGLFSGNSYSDLGYEDTSYDPLVTSSGSAADNTVSSLAREKRVTPVGGGKDIVTVMVYMCGTDLESKYAMASKDLQEMINADLSDKVNLIVETGGCSKWQNQIISSDVNQIYRVEDAGLRLLEKDAGTSAMTDPENLADFIRYCQKHYPADRNMLILWDHGGGSLSGYGYDEKNPGSSMTLDKIAGALKDADCTFDIIGYDACLMATLENALVCESYADYLLASEETEPGTGWYYTAWLNDLSENTSISSVELSKSVIDSFVSSCTQSSSGAQVTLSVMDLAELRGTVPDAFRDFASATNALIRSDGYRQVSDARAGVRQFAQSSKINQIDLVDLCNRIGTDEANALTEALLGCVKYNRATMSRCNGVSIYFPYENTKNVKSAVASYEALGIDGEYAKCIQSFASLETAGQLTGAASQTVGGTDILAELLSGSGASPVGSLLSSFTGGAAGFGVDPAMVMELLGGLSGRSMPEEYDWLDTELIADKAETVSLNYLDPARLVPTEKNGVSVLMLTEEEWSLVQTVELNIFADCGGSFGGGFMDLGLDNTFDFDEDGDLLLTHDGTWLTLNGNVCAYYLESDTQQEDGSWVTVGRIPALLNGALVNLRVVFDDEHPAGTVTGAYPLYDDGVDVQAKGNIAVEAGDEIELLGDHYAIDGTYTASYTMGSSFTVPESGLRLENLILEESVSASWRITDIYGNHYWIIG